MLSRLRPPTDSVLLADPLVPIPCGVRHHDRRSNLEIGLQEPSAMAKWQISSCQLPKPKIRNVLPPAFSALRSPSQRSVGCRTASGHVAAAEGVTPESELVSPNDDRMGHPVANEPVRDGTVHINHPVGGRGSRVTPIGAVSQSTWSVGSARPLGHSNGLIRN